MKKVLNLSENDLNFYLDPWKARNGFTTSNERGGSYGCSGLKAGSYLFSKQIAGGRRMRFILQTANVTAEATNCVYPNKVEVTSADELKEAVKFDHVCGEFQKNYRSISNFKKTNVVVMDCDNDHSENPDDWITMESLEERFEDIDYAVAPSRHHMVEKDGKAARPKFHVYFPIEETDSAEHCAAIKRAIHKAYPFFDDNALDAA